MRRGVSGFGFVMLIVVGGVVVYLALKAWEGVQPTARDLREPVFAGEQVLQDGGGVEHGAPAPPPIHSSLQDAQRKTQAHSQRVTTALGESQ